MRPRLLEAALVLGVGFCWCATAEQATAAGRPALARTTTVIAERSGYQDVWVPQKFRFSARAVNNGTILMEPSDSPVSGVILRRMTNVAGAPVRPRPSPLLIALRLRPSMRACGSFCDADDQLHVTGYDDLASPTGPNFDYEEDLTVVLPPGGYRLYVITPPGRALTARLHFPDLNGKVVVSPLVPIRMEAPELPFIEQVGSDETGHVRFGAAFRLEQPGVTIQAMTGYEGAGAKRAEHCFYSSFASEPDSFGPGCPGATFGSMSPWLSGPGGGSGKIHTRFGNPSLAPGAYGLGGNIQSAGIGPWDAVGAAIELESSAPPAAAGPKPGKAKLRFADLRGRRLRLGLYCSGDAICRGGVSIFGGRYRARFAVPGGRSRTVGIVVARRDHKRIARQRRIVVEVRSASTSTRVRLRLRR